MHPRDYTINREPRDRYLKFKADNPIRPASVQTPAEMEAFWCWDEIAMLRAALLEAGFGAVMGIVGEPESENYDKYALGPKS